ncbi:hypothetical protein V3C99_007361 [Haemonchus contortus]
MAVFLPESVHGNETIRINFEIEFTRYTYFLALYILYGIPSLIVTARIVRAIIDPAFKNFFRTPFFVLFTHDCIMNAIFFVYDIFAVRVPLSGLITDWITTLPIGSYINAIYVLSYYSMYMTFYSAVSLSLARTLIICLPMSGNERVKQLLPVFFLAIYLLPILTTWFLYSVITYIRIGMIPGYGVGYDYKKLYPQWRNSICLAAAACASSALFLVSSAATLVKLRTVSRSTSDRSAPMARAERSLTILTSTTCLCMLTLTFTNVYFLVYYDVNFALTLRPFQFDLLLFLPIWVLYFTHPAFRPKSSLNVSVIRVSNK